MSRGIKFINKVIFFFYLFSNKEQCTSFLSDKNKLTFYLIRKMKNKLLHFVFLVFCFANKKSINVYLHTNNIMVKAYSKFESID